MARILLVAGEASGDLLGGLLLEELRKIAPGHSVCGVGSKDLEAQGMELMFRSEEIEMVGGIEGLSRLPRIYHVYSLLKEMITSKRVDALLLIDYPGMNLKLAQVAKAVDMPVVYYVSPQVWAWRPGRIKKIKRAVDLMMVILPFEEKMYREAGVPVEYVGHPLVEVVSPRIEREGFRKSLEVPGGRRLVALLPGSRRQELDQLLGEMAAASAILSERMEVSFVLPVAPALSLEDLNRRWAGLACTEGVDCKIIKGDTYSALAAADVAMVASGTATLEAALLGVPHVLVYNAHPITYAIGKRLVRVKWLSLVNILLDREVVPELLQSKAKASLMAREVERLLDGSGEGMKSDLLRLREMLGPPGASARAAGSLAAFLKERLA